MSKEYDQYLETHRENVTKGFDWLEQKCPWLIPSSAVRYQITHEHDKSKNDPEEYDAYDKYFYTKKTNRSYQVVNDFNIAWLHHIHNNPHHWQHWILINDDPKLGEVCLYMPTSYVIEMICDWWAFSWQKGDLFEIFRWYEEHKSHIKLHPETRRKVEGILHMMEEQLTKDEGEFEYEG